MPDQRAIVVNTGPLIALVAAAGNLCVLERLYARVVVPFEVGEEILADNASRFAADAFLAASWIEKRERPTMVPVSLLKSLGVGEAAVIQCALTDNIGTVAIDEAAGRRIARLNGLVVTGSLGILLHASRTGFPINLTEAIDLMRKRGIWLGEGLVARALHQAAIDSISSDRGDLRGD